MYIETWKTIAEFPAYDVSSKGRVRSHAGLKKIAYDRSGYPTVQLSYLGHQYRRTVHSLVAAEFIGPRPVGLVINHKDGNKSNPSPGNLEYVTVRENARHAVATGLHKALRGDRHPLSIVSEKQIPEIFADAASGMPRRHLAAKYRLSRSGIDSVLHRESWRHVTVPEAIRLQVKAARKHRNVGAHNPIAKLTDAHVVDIFRLAKAGVKGRDIAAKFGSGHGLISQVLHRVIWRHVKIPPDLLPRNTPSGRLTWK